MDFLTLCQKTRQECRIPGTGPTAVTGQTGELKRVVEWVQQAWIELQTKYPNWRWMRSRFTVDTTEDDDEYAPTDCTDVLTSSAIDRFAYWLVDDREDPPRIHLKSAGSGTETWMVYVTWESFKRLYRFGAQTQNSGHPIHISIDPQENLVIGPKPNGIYVVDGDYQRGAQVLAADGDTPDLPVRFHYVIVYEAMKKYGGSESATEVLYRAEKEGGPLMRQLELSQLPTMRLAGPLA